MMLPKNIISLKQSFRKSCVFGLTIISINTQCNAMEDGIPLIIKPDMSDDKKDMRPAMTPFGYPECDNIAEHKSSYNSINNMHLNVVCNKQYYDNLMNNINALLTKFSDSTNRKLKLIYEKNKKIESNMTSIDNKINNINQYIDRQVSNENLIKIKNNYQIEQTVYFNTLNNNCSNKTEMPKKNEIFRTTNNYRQRLLETLRNVNTLQRKLGRNYTYIKLKNDCVLIKRHNKANEQKSV